MDIKVVAYDSEWPNKYQSEKEALTNCLGSIISRIHHIGSTSVEGLAAKPIIDIILEVSNLDLLDKSTGAFQDLGYEVMGEFGIVGRRYFRKGRINRTHQIHAFKSGDLNIKRHIAFRDYLKEHPLVKSEYEGLKKDLAKSCNNNIDVYCDGKDDFVKYYETKALEWFKDT